MADPDAPYLPPGANYVLPRDDQERKRLNEQHKYLLHAVYGGRLVYDLSVRLPADSWILDAGTGSGAWLMDMAKNTPHTMRLHGVDISANLFPTEHPSNVAFTASSITSLPAEWSGRFALVNQRLMVAALRVSEWPMAIAEIFRVLRPGGRVQFVEARRQRETSSAARRKLSDVLFALAAKQDLVVDPAADIPSMLAKAGFDAVRSVQKYVYVGECEGEYGMMGKRSFGGAYRGMKRGVMALEGLGVVQSEQEYDEMMETLEAEWDQGISNHFSYGIICAQKPEARIMSRL